MEKSLKKLVVHCADPRAAGQAFTPERAIADGVHLARDLVNEPANVLGPGEFAAKVPRLLEAGARFVGGCCGTDPSFIEAMRRELDG